MNTLLLLHYFFIAFHSTLILFNLTGWIWTKSQRLHLLIITLTLLSWFGLGLFFGWGYCPCTDWHWQVKKKLGETYLPSSYIKYYADKITGHYWNATLIDGIVVGAALTAFTLSVWKNYKRIKNRSFKN